MSNQTIFSVLPAALASIGAGLTRPDGGGATAMTTTDTARRWRKTDPLADAIALIEAHGKMVIDGPKPAEPDWERYRGMKDAYLGTTDPLPDPISPSGKRTIERLLAARNHDPDVAVMVQWARKKLTAMDRDAALLAPFAAIKDE
jgi:hypothetical protein